LYNCIGETLLKVIEAFTKAVTLWSPLDFTSYAIYLASHLFVGPFKHPIPDWESFMTIMKECSVSSTDLESLQGQRDHLIEEINNLGIITITPRVDKVAHIKAIMEIEVTKNYYHVLDDNLADIRLEPLSNNITSATHSLGDAQALLAAHDFSIPNMDNPFVLSMQLPITIKSTTTTAATESTIEPSKIVPQLIITHNHTALNVTLPYIIKKIPPPLRCLYLRIQSCTSAVEVTQSGAGLWTNHSTYSGAFENKRGDRKLLFTSHGERLIVPFRIDCH
jgi:hypothetical protein